MLVQDALNPQSTRPKIAYGAFWVVTFVTVIFVCSYMYAVMSDQSDLVESVAASWPFAGVLVFPFVGWLNTYFGMLNKEQRDKLNAANGKEVSTGGLIETVMKLKGR